MNFIYKPTYLILFLISVHVNFLYAQNNQLRAYTLEDGLPQSQVYDVIQDHVGYLWLGTQGGGVCRFDGNTFEVWNKNDGLLSDYIHSLAYAKDSLFIGTKRGLSIKIKNRFINIGSPRINKIRRIKGETYLATNLGIYKYKKNLGLIKIALNPKINTSVINDIVYDGKLFWIATNKGLWKLNNIQSNASIIERHSAYEFTAAVFYNNKIYAAAFNQGILVINTHARTYGNLWIRKPVRVTSITVNNNELWFATDNDGINIIDAGKNIYIKKINRRNGLSVSHTRKSIVDRQSNVWIATSGGGLYKYFQNNFIHYDQNTGLKGNRVYAVHDAEGTGIWASNSEAGLVFIDSTTVYQVPQDDQLLDVKIKTITSDVQGNIWAGTDGKGILFKEIKQLDSIITDTVYSSEANADPIIVTDTISKMVTKNHVLNKDKGLPSDWIRTIQVVGNTIWVATYSAGIFNFMYDPDKQHISSLKKFAKRNGIKDVQIRDMKQGPNGKMWYATQNGHLGYIENNRVKHLGKAINQPTSISTLLFYEDILYIGTAGRGVWWSEINNSLVFKKLKGRKQPYSDNVYQMIFDDKNNLWVGSERGVDRIELNQSNEIVDVFHFGRNDGFLGIETCLNAVDKDKEGNLWFGAIYGLTKYQPTEITKTTIKPSLHFEEVEVDYRSIDSIQLGVWTNSNHVLQLTPNQTELSFTYKSIDLDHPNDIEYRWRLNHSGWSPWSSDHKQNLAGLAYGSHSFWAQSRNYRWEESDPISFQFFIDSPIYEKLGFQLGVLGLVVLAIGGYGLSYIRRVKQKNKEERERLEMQNHLLSLEQKALRLQMNPHFIFNVLNGIKAMGTSNPSRMNTTINTFATLLRETLYNSRKDYITLKQEIHTLRHYIEIEQLMASKPFVYEIEVDTNLDTEEILIPPMLIQPFVENAIRHGILKGQRDGELKISFYLDQDFLYCTVVDNGQGIFQSQKQKTKTDHQSMALTVTRERLESISGKNSLQIREIIEKGKVVAGTEIKFRIPLETDY